jgi:hypothetical protein
MLRKQSIRNLLLESSASGLETLDNEIRLPFGKDILANESPPICEYLPA